MSNNITPIAGAATVTMKMTERAALNLLWEALDAEPCADWPSAEDSKKFGSYDEDEVAEAKDAYMRVALDAIRDGNPNSFLDTLFYPATLVGPVLVQREFNTGMVQVTARKPSEALIRIARWMIEGEAA